MRSTQRWVAGLWLVLASVVVSANQTEIDRLLVRVHGSVITQSDVRRARALHLVADVASDESVQRGLENRLLMLREVGMATPPVDASEDNVASRRRAWEQAVGAAAGQLSRYGMSEADLTAWLRDDTRIEALVRRQFGDVGEANRDKAVAGWVDRLRQRAGLR